MLHGMLIRIQHPAVAPVGHVASGCLPRQQCTGIRTPPSRASFKEIIAVHQGPRHREASRKLVGYCCVRIHSVSSHPRTSRRFAPCSTACGPVQRPVTVRQVNLIDRRPWEECAVFRITPPMHRIRFAVVRVTNGECRRPIPIRIGNLRWDRVSSGCRFRTGLDLADIGSKSIGRSPSGLHPKFNRNRCVVRGDRLSNRSIGHEERERYSDGGGHGPCAQNDPSASGRRTADDAATNNSHAHTNGLHHRNPAFTVSSKPTSPGRDLHRTPGKKI